MRYLALHRKVMRWGLYLVGDRKLDRNTTISTLFSWIQSLPLDLKPEQKLIYVYDLARSLEKTSSPGRHINLTNAAQCSFDVLKKSWWFETQDPFFYIACSQFSHSEIAERCEVINHNHFSYVFIKKLPARFTLPLASLIEFMKTARCGVYIFLNEKFRQLCADFSGNYTTLSYLDKKINKLCSILSDSEFNSRLSAIKTKLSTKQNEILLKLLLLPSKIILEYDQSVIHFESFRQFYFDFDQPCSPIE
jgi:hypothetical protein